MIRTIKPRKNFQIKTILFANSRDEKYITEWVAHHLNIGFDVIYIFDHKSKIPIDKIFTTDYAKRRVKIERIEEEGAIKMKLMNKAIEIAKNFGADWMIYLDVDEYMCVNGFTNIKHFLTTHPNCESIGVNWLMFGSNFLKDDKGMLMETYTKSDLKLNKHVKTFVRPQYATEALNPHYYNIITKNYHALPFRRIAEPYHFNSIDLTCKEVGVFIAHYVYQSEESFSRRKLKLPADDTGTTRNTDHISIHNLYNQVDNLIMKMKYSPLIRETIKKLIYK